MLAMRRWFAAGASLTPSLAAGTTFSALGESIVAPSTYTSLAVVAAKSRERWRIFSFIVPAHRQGEGATISSVASLDATWVRGSFIAQRITGVHEEGGGMGWRHEAEIWCLHVRC